MGQFDPEQCYAYWDMVLTTSVGADATQLVRDLSSGLGKRVDLVTEQQTAALILKPGFSTAATVSEVSGRGVGTDVVQRGVEALRGTLQMESKPGPGTTITLRILLTLAIIDGLLVEAGGDCFVVPLSNISSCQELAGEPEAERRRSVVTVRAKGPAE